MTIDQFMDDDPRLTDQKCREFAMEYGAYLTEKAFEAIDLDQEDMDDLMTMFI